MKQKKDDPTKCSSCGRDIAKWESEDNDGRCSGCLYNEDAEEAYRDIERAKGKK